jgi:hypothetical protein
MRLNAVEAGTIREMAKRIREQTAMTDPRVSMLADSIMAIVERGDIDTEAEL